MRAIILAFVGVLTIPVAMAGETDDAHRLAVSGRDGYWNCLARELPRESNKGLSERDFGVQIAGACASERQNFRVALTAFLGLQFPEIEAGANLITANNAIALAQKDIVTAFVRRKAAPR